MYYEYFLPVRGLPFHFSNNVFFFFVFFRATPMTHGSSQAMGWIGAAAASLHHNHSKVGSEQSLRLNTTAHNNARSLTHWVMPGIKPVSSCILVIPLSLWAPTNILMKFNLWFCPGFMLFILYLGTLLILRSWFQYFWGGARIFSFNFYICLWFTLNYFSCRP